VIWDMRLIVSFKNGCCVWRFHKILPYLNRQILQAQSQALLQRSTAGVAEDDGVWIDVNAIGIDARAFWLYKCDALLHCA
jgi:hypothetical protein